MIRRQNKPQDQAKRGQAPRAGMRGQAHNQKTAETSEALKVREDYEDHAREVDEYVAGVQLGAVAAGELVRQAVERYIGDRNRIRFDERKAARVINFVQDYCRHSSGAFDGDPFVLSPWQKFIVWNLFGFLGDDGFRRYRYALISVGRKNGKSTFAAAIELYMQAADNEARAQCYIASTKMEQSNIVLDEADNMVRQEPQLSDRFLQYYNRLVYEPTRSTFHKISSDKPFDGLGPHLCIMDELHAWREVHRKFFNTMRSGSGAVRQPLLLVITTAGDDASTIYNEEVEYCKDVLSGLVEDDRTFAFIATLDEDDDPFDEKNWEKANPNIDVSCRRDYLKDQSKLAQAKPSSRNIFLRYHCNQQTSSTERIIAPKDWAACQAPPPDEYPISVHGGFDLARSRDFASWCVIKEYEGGIYQLIPRIYTCRSREKDLRTQFVQDWIDSGELVQHSGTSVDYDEIEADIKQATQEHGVTSWGYDPTFAHQIAQHMIDEFGENIVFKFSQSHAKYNEPMREFESAAFEHRLRHDGNRCMAWQAGNLQKATNHKDHWMPDKAAARSKIDTMVAAIMGLSECLYEAREREWTEDEMGL